MGQFFFVFTLLSFVRGFNLFVRRTRSSKAQRCLEQAARTVTYSPMLCVLFLTVRLRAFQLNQQNSLRNAGLDAEEDTVSGMAEQEQGAAVVSKAPSAAPGTSTSAIPVELEKMFVQLLGRNASGELPHSYFPAPWLQTAILVTTCVAIAQTVLVLILSCFAEVECAGDGQV